MPLLATETYNRNESIRALEDIINDIKNIIQLHGKGIRGEGLRSERDRGRERERERQRQTETDRDRERHRDRERERREQGDRLRIFSQG